MTKRRTRLPGKPPHAERAAAAMIPKRARKSSARATKPAGFQEESEPFSPQPAISRGAFAKISAVEGIHLSDEAKQAFSEFDRRKLTPEERRKAVMARFKREPTE